MANAGLIVVDTSYRQGSAHPHPAATNDLADVTRWTRKLWPEYAVGVVGSSSGGWYAMAMAAGPPDDIPFPFAIALCPVANPGLRAAYLRSCIALTAEADGYSLYHTPESATSMLETQKGYFETDEAMVSAGDMLNVAGKYHNNPTRSLVILGSADKNVPPVVTAALQSWATETVTLGGYGHELQKEPPSDLKDTYMPRLRQFIIDALQHC